VARLIGSSRFDEHTPLTGPATLVLLLAAYLAGEGQTVGLSHLLGGLWFERRGIAACALRDCGALVIARGPGILIRSYYRSLAYHRPQLQLASMDWDSCVDECLRLADEVSRIEGHGYVGTEHLALALARLPSANRVLSNAHVEAPELEVAVLAYLLPDDDLD
jgi:hypothetical protein